MDCDGNVNLLDAAMAAPEPPKHFVMLSAFCVRQPELVVCMRNHWAWLTLIIPCRWELLRGPYAVALVSRGKLVLVPLQFQHAKLKFETYLRSKAPAITHTIIRPTAFFKSVSGQLEVVQQGYPYVMFGDGEICK